MLVSALPSGDEIETSWFRETFQASSPDSVRETVPVDKERFNSSAKQFIKASGAERSI